MKFKQNRSIYERRVQEKNNQEGVEVQLTSYRSSVEEHILALMLRAKQIGADSIKFSTEDELKASIKVKSCIDPAEYDIAQIEAGIADVKLGIVKKNLEMNVWELDLRYSTVLNNLGYSKFIKQQPELAVKHILKRVTHPALKRRILLTYQLRKKELKNDYGSFRRELAKEARGVDRQEAASTHGRTEAGSDSEKAEVGNGNPRTKKRSYNGKPIGNGDADRTKTTKQSKMECLNPKCKGDHPVRKCLDTSKEEASQLLKDFFEGRKNGKNERKGKPRGILGSLGGALASSAMLRASFCQGALETVAKADQGSGCNLMPLSMLKNLRKSDPKVKVQELQKPQPYGTVIKVVQLVQCTHKVVSNIMLYIRHGTQLMLRSVEWMVCDCETDFVIIGEQTLRELP